MLDRFYFQQYRLALVLFNPEIGPYQVLPLRATVELGAMAMMHTTRLFSVISRALVGELGLGPESDWNT